MKRVELMEILQLGHREYFVDNYLTPALDLFYVELTHPETPNHPDQKYKLTEKGVALRQKLLPLMRDEFSVTPQVTPKLPPKLRGSLHRT